MAVDLDKAFKASMGAFQSSLNDIEKLQTKQNARAEKQRTLEQKFGKEQDKAAVKSFKLQERRDDKELAALRKKHDLARNNLNLIESKTRKGRSDDISHLREVNRELSRGPLGTLLSSAGGSLGGVIRGGASLAGAIGSGLLGMVMGYALKGYQNKIMTEQQLGPSIGMANTNLMNIASSANKGKGGNLGFNVAERAQLMPLMGRATGVVNPRAIMEAMRSTGMGAEEVSQMFGAIRQGGTKFSGTSDQLVNGRLKNVTGTGEGKKEFEKTIAAGLFSGLEKARLPEYFQGVAQIMQQTGGVLSGNVTSAGINHFMTMIGSSGLSGLQGARGANVASQINQGLIQGASPGGNPAVKAALMQYMGFGTPGGTNSFIGAKLDLEQGLSNPEVIKKVISGQMKKYGGSQDPLGNAAQEFQEAFGTSLHDSIAIIKSFNDSGGGKAFEDKLKGVQDQSGTLEQQAYKSMITTGTSLRSIAGRFDASVNTGELATKAIEGLEDMEAKLTTKLLEWLNAHWADLMSALNGIKDALTVIGKLTAGLAIGSSKYWGEKGMVNGLEGFGRQILGLAQPLTTSEYSSVTGLNMMFSRNRMNEAVAADKNAAEAKKQYRNMIDMGVDPSTILGFIKSNESLSRADKAEAAAAVERARKAAPGEGMKVEEVTKTVKRPVGDEIVTTGRFVAKPVAPLVVPTDTASRPSVQSSPDPHTSGTGNRGGNK